MKITMNDIDKHEDDAPVYTWPKFITKVLWIFLLLFVMVKIVQAFAS